MMGRSGLFGSLHSRQANKVLYASTTTGGTFLLVLVVLTDALGKFKTVSTFLAFEFIDRHSKISQRKSNDGKR